MRREDWQARLWRELEAAEGRPFVYGKHDCVRLAARCLDAMLVPWGEPYCVTVSTLYKDKRGALRLVMRQGIEHFVDILLGAPVPRNLARVGDVCAVELPTGPAIGICTGPRVAVAASPEGVLYLPLAQATAAWRVD
jgi:hypothetical protein